MERTSDAGYRGEKGLTDKKLRWKGTQWERSGKLKGKIYSNGLGLSVCATWMTM